jgi:DegV family protein with EDD domain
MREYVIFADSGCDIHPETLSKWGIRLLDLTFMFDGDDHVYTNKEMPVETFYRKIREGAVARTSAANTADIEAALEPVLAQGWDVLYLVFSSGLSSTYDYANVAVRELRAKYPERKILTVDSLSASSGYGLFLYLVSRQRDAGADIESAARHAEILRHHLCHWFTVDDLIYLKRGGRISPTVALVGSILGVKPVLHMDDAGHLINISKVRGRKASIKALADKYGELSADREAPVFISHGDCPEDARYLASLMKQQYGVDVALIEDIGPIIGAHSGPGTLALYFIGKER